MRLIACVLLALMALVGAGPAHAGEVRRDAFASKSLGRDFPFLVYLPEGYWQSATHYPVLYLLHGAGGDENSWTEHGAILDTADALIRSGAIQPTLIVMPGCPTCWWVDGAREKAETAFWTELVPAVAKRYRTLEVREGRLVAGLSAGGYGAVRFAMRHADKLAAAAALSPAVYHVTPPAHSAARRQPPFRGPDGAFSQEIWAANNYPRLIDDYFAGKPRVPLYLISGNRDHYGIAAETMLLFTRMHERQPGLAQLRVIDGDHNWTLWAAAVDDALKYIYQFAARPQMPPRRGPEMTAEAGRAAAARR